MKTISSRQLAAIKRVAQNVSSLAIKRDKLKEQIEKYISEKKQCEEEMACHEAGVKLISGGFTSEDLLVRSVVDTGKVDKEGRAIKTVKYEPRSGRLDYIEDIKAYGIIEDEVPSDEFHTEEAASAEFLGVEFL